jgi:hypothetical protein
MPIDCSQSLNRYLTLREYLRGSVEALLFLSLEESLLCDTLRVT